jgi:thermitase
MKETTRSLPFRFLFLTALIVAFLSIPLPARLAVSAQKYSGDRTGGEVIVQLKPGVQVSRMLSRYNFEILRKHTSNQYLFAFQDALSVEQVIDRVKKDPDILWAEPNFTMELDQLRTNQRSSPFLDQRSTPFLDGVSPSSYFDQYALTKIKSEAANAYTCGAGIIVAVIDTGLDTNSPVNFAYASPRDFVSNDWDPSESGSGGTAYGHGTFVSALVKLVAPYVTIMPIRTFLSDGSGDVSTVVTAIRYAADNNARVINMSFSMSSSSQTLQDAINYASGKGATLVASAGNEGTTTPRYPASCSNVLSVAATDQNDRRASFSSYGSSVDVSAPGVSLYSVYPNGQWAWWDGTSFAAPLVSGEVALLLARGRAASRVTSTADSVPDSGMGSGRINCLRAVQ